MKRGDAFLPKVLATDAAESRPRVLGGEDSRTAALAVDSHGAVGDASCQMAIGAQLDEYDVVAVSSARVGSTRRATASATPRATCAGDAEGAAAPAPATAASALLAAFQAARQRDRDAAAIARERRRVGLAASHDAALAASARDHLVAERARAAAMAAVDARMDTVEHRLAHADGSLAHLNVQLQSLVCIR